MGESSPNWTEPHRHVRTQDSMAVILAGSEEKWRERGDLFMIADGMGAHAAGELASKIATDVVPLTYHKLVGRPPPEALAEAIRDANTQINVRGRANEDFRGMGTTVSVLVLLPGSALAAHVGDSRAYRWRAGRLEQLTRDHSLVWEIREARQIPEEEVPAFIPKNVITRSLGPNDEVEVDLEGPFSVQAGDIFLLCSDGLSGPVKDEEIGKILGCLPPEEAVQALVDLANLRGGPDNITVVVVRVTGPDPADADAVASRRTPPRLGELVSWLVLGVFALAAVGLGALGHDLLAAVSIGVAVAGGVAALVQSIRARRTAPESDAPRLGRGPYTASPCEVDAEFVGHLLGVTDQLRDAATNEHWAVDWMRFNAHQDRAIAAVKAGDYPEAVREHCHAISFMMSELRSQRARKPADGTGQAGLL
jgi:serine/threonine protein phosphatase PrpC